ncbi:MAG: hypothetical protein U0900_14825 [Myxococcota bacterium]
MGAERKRMMQVKRMKQMKQTERMMRGAESRGRAGSLASRFASLVAIGGSAVVGVGGVASSVGAHTAGVAIPPESDYMVRWHQPHYARPVNDWQIEVTPVADPTRRFIANAQVAPEPSCWALSVPIAEPAQVRVRSVVGTQVSSWTRATVVPEPGLGVGVAAATGALALLARRDRRKRTRPPGSNGPIEGVD